MQKLRRLLTKVRYLFPSKLPNGSKEFDQFCESLFQTYDIPDTDSYRHSIAVMIQHLSPTTVYQSKSHFAGCIHNAQAREVAFYKIQDIQEKKKAALEAEKAAEELTAIAN